MNFIRLDKRQKQVIGAICILNFSDKYGLYYEGLYELNNHLFSILISNDLGEWNNRGLLLEIVGRGEPLPQELDGLIESNLKNDFYSLIDNVVEIGIIDLFGEDTDYPNIFLNNALSILKKHNIYITISTDLFFENGNDSWGEVWNMDRFLSLKSFYNDLIKKHHI